MVKIKVIIKEYLLGEVQLLTRLVEVLPMTVKIKILNTYHLNIEMNIDSKMERFIKDNGRER